MQKPGVIIGQKGVKYGLITRKDDKKGQLPATGRLAAFGGDSDSDEEQNVGAQVARQAARKVADSKVQDMYAAALAEDPNAFEYDSLYDSMQEQKAAPKQQEKLARQPKYIASLLEQAEVRKREQGITYERMLLKERQKEDHMYDNTEKFITSAYRRKLEEDKKWQESQRLKEMEEERNDVTKLGNMNNFFTNLTKNVAMGGSAAAAARSKPGTAAAGGEGSPSASGRASPEGHASQEEQQQQQEPAQPQDLQRQHSDEQPEQQHSRQRQGSPAGQEQQAAAAAAGQAGSQAAQDQQQRQQQDKQLSQPQQQPQREEPAAVAVAGKRKNTEDAVAAARERYLARKRQQH